MFVKCEMNDRMVIEWSNGHDHEINDVMHSDAHNDHMILDIWDILGRHGDIHIR